MATDGQVQLPPDSTGHALRTQEIEPTTTMGGDDGLLHQQVITLADPGGVLPGEMGGAPVPTREATNSPVVELLQLVLVELQRIALTLAVMADNYASDDDLAIRDM